MPDVMHAVTPHPLIRRFEEARRAEDLAILEGFHALKHALRFGAEVEIVVATDPLALESLATQLAPDLSGCFMANAAVVPAPIFRQLGRRPPHTGVLAIARRPPIDIHKTMSAPGPVVVLEDPRHLGNLGAVVRVAAAADAAGVFTTGAIDPWDPAAIRGSAGLHFAIPVVRLKRVPVANRPLVVMDPAGTELHAGCIPPEPLLAFGTERYGVSRELLSKADARYRIPMRPGISSLNLATSVATVLFAARLAPVPAPSPPRPHQPL
jgi:RNA methyltransferase, TrmH family